MPPRKPAGAEGPRKSSKADLVMVTTLHNAWACYLDGELRNWGGGQMSARELLKALDGRGVASEHWVEFDDVTEFPRLLSALIGVEHES